jgi:hypothetical protein
MRLEQDIFPVNAESSLRRSCILRGGSARLITDADLSRKERGHRGVRPRHPETGGLRAAGGGFLKWLGSASLCVLEAPAGATAFSDRFLIRSSVFVHLACRKWRA